MPKDRSRKRRLIRKRKEKAVYDIRSNLTLGQRLALIAMDLVLAALLALSFSGMTFALLGLEINLYSIIPSILLSLPLIALLTWGRKNLLVLAGIIAVTALYILPSREDLIEFGGRWLTRFASVLEPAMYRSVFSSMSDSQYAVMREESLVYLVFIAVFILSLLAYLMAARFRMPVVAAVTLIALVIACTHFSRDYGNIWSLWGLVALVPLFFLDVGGTIDVLPHKPFSQYVKNAVSGLLCGLLLILPTWLLANRFEPNDMYSYRAQGFVEDLTDLLPDQLRPARNFDPFSINRSGYYPRNELLGGSVTLNPNPVLSISGTASGLLKGQTSQTYTGFSWVRDRDEDTWRFGSPLYSSEEEEIFELDDRFLRDLGIISLSPTRHDYQIELLQGGISVLFTIGRADDLEFNSNTAMQAFFNNDGVVYAQYPMQAGQGYSLSGSTLPLAPLLERIEAVSSEDMTAYNNRFGPGEDGRFTYTGDGQDVFLQLPETSETLQPGGTVYEETLLVARGEDPEGMPQDVLSQLMRLVDYHRRMDYSLTVPIPPDGQDFVEHVLEIRTGYCVYFATSLTVMARILGIPARYVEGFGIPGGAQRVMDSNGYVITGEQAHAWTEVYIDGLGWIALDPTPGGVAGGESDIPDPTETPDVTPMPTMPEETDYLPVPTNGPIEVPDTDEGDGGLSAAAIRNLLLAAAGLLLIVFILYKIGTLKRLKLRLLLTKPALALRYLAKGKKRDDDTNADQSSASWNFPDPTALRNLVLLYWQEIRLELRRAGRSQEWAGRRAAFKERRRIKKEGEDFAMPERDFYETKVQSPYKASAFVEFLNEEARRKEEEEKEAAAKRIIYENKLKQSTSLLDRWSDPALIGTWRRELAKAFEELPVLKREQWSDFETDSLSEYLTQAERLAEQAAFAGPDTVPEADDIYKLHAVLRRLRYLRRHWPDAKN